MHDRHDAFVPECPNCLTKAQNSLHIRVQTAYDPQSIKGVRVCLRERVSAFRVCVCACVRMWVNAGVREFLKPMPQTSKCDVYCRLY